MSFGAKESMSPERIRILASPKREYIPIDIYKHKEFRGMIHADNQEALVTVFKGASKNSKYNTLNSSQIFTMRNIATARDNQTISGTARDD